MDSARKPNVFTPIGDVAGTAGYALVSATPEASLAKKAADKFLNDSLLLSQLTERVYELLLEDMRVQRERVNNYANHRGL